MSLQAGFSACGGSQQRHAPLHRQILYGFVYDIDYSELQEYNAALGKIGNNLNQITKRMNATGNKNHIAVSILLNNSKAKSRQTMIVLKFIGSASVRQAL